VARDEAGFDTFSGDTFNCRIPSLPHTPSLRSNPDCLRGKILDCFASRNDDEEAVLPQALFRFAENNRAAPPLAAPFRMRHDRGKSNNQAAIRARRDKGGFR
jgi:hypothetical protein